MTEIERGTEFSAEDRGELREARRLLENPNLAIRLTSALGTPIEKGLKLLPQGWSDKVQGAVEISLQKALQIAVQTLGPRKKPRRARLFLHKAAVMGSGGLGGVFGLAGIAAELPVSTTIMLRSIAEIARSEGADPASLEVRLDCLQVFALGGRTPIDDASETGYYALRALLATTLNQATAFIAEKGLTSQGAPALVRFLSVIASRFSIIVSEKIAAMAVPAIGAAGGAMINMVFISHFQNMARGHFKIRKLERKYGPEAVKREYLAQGGRKQEAGGRKKEQGQNS